MELSFSELEKMSEEVVADDGPGSKGWKAAGSATQRVNQAVMDELRTNGGKMRGSLEPWPFLIVTTTGARSGKRRSVPLAHAIIDGRLVIIASMAGSVRNPPWYHNLVANPDVTVELHGETFGAKAVVIEGDDRDELFRRVCEKVDVFAGYQARTERTIPVVELKRV